MKKVLDKIGCLDNKFNFFSNDYLPILLFVVIIINFIPMGITNAFTKLPPSSSSTFIEVTCMLIEFLIMGLFYAIHLNEIKFNKKKMLCLIVVTFFMLIAQIKNFLQGAFYFKDILNIGVFFVNVLLFYICLYDYKIKEKKIFVFFKSIIMFAVIAIIWNSILFFKDIIAEIGIIDINYDYSHLNNIKGFFGNRTALSFIILLAIISSEILKTSGKISPRCSIVLKIAFFVGIWSTHCKTAYILMSIIYTIFIILNQKRIMIKIISVVAFLAFSIVGLFNVLGYFPSSIDTNIDKIDKEKYIIKPRSKNTDEKTIEKSNSILAESKSKLNELVVSKNRINNLSGRKAIWESTINHLKENPIDLILGVGKFSSVRFLTINGKKYQHFHNLILELIMTGGLFEIIFVLVLFSNVIMKIRRSDLSFKLKIVYYTSFAMYLINSMLETYGKFSIGYHDVLCLVFFISIPLLHANSQKIRK